MRSYGEVNGVQYRRHGFCIRHLGTEYELRLNGEKKLVWVDTMKELREEIAVFAGESYQYGKDKQETLYV